MVSEDHIILRPGDPTAILLSQAIQVSEVVVIVSMRRCRRHDQVDK